MKKYINIVKTDECFICQQGKHDILVFNPTLDACCLEPENERATKIVVLVAS